MGVSSIERENVMAALATVSKLKILVKRPELSPADEYAVMMLDQATRAVRFEGKPASLYWSLTPDEELDQTAVPDEIEDIVLWVAARAFLNPRNLERRTAGPVSETFRDTGVYGLELTETEKQRVAEVAEGEDSGHSRRLWTQPVGAGKVNPPRVWLPDRPLGDPILMAEGDDQTWMYYADSELAD